jgi:hypothetical protein
MEAVNGCLHGPEWGRLKTTRGSTCERRLSGKHFHGIDFRCWPLAADPRPTSVVAVALVLEELLEAGG